MWTVGEAWEGETAIGYARSLWQRLYAGRAAVVPLWLVRPPPPARAMDVTTTSFAASAKGYDRHRSLMLVSPCDRGTRLSVIQAKLRLARTCRAWHAERHGLSVASRCLRGKPRVLGRVGLGMRPRRIAAPCRRSSVGAVRRSIGAGMMVQMCSLPIRRRRRSYVGEGDLAFDVLSGVDGRLVPLHKDLDVRCPRRRRCRHCAERGCGRGCGRADPRRTTVKGVMKSTW